MRLAPPRWTTFSLLTAALLLAGSLSASAQTVDLRNLTIDAQEAMKQVCKVDEGRIERRHLECLDYHVRAWRKLVFKPDLESLSLRQARQLREACLTDLNRGPAPWARCIEQQMVEQRVDVVYPDLAALTAPMRNRVRQMCDSAAKVSGHREAACLEKLRDRFLEHPPADAKQSAISATNTRQGDSPKAEQIGRAASTGDRRVAALTPGVLDFHQLDPADPFWPGWRGARPAEPTSLSGPERAPDELFSRISPSVYVVLSAASVADFRAGRHVRQGSAVAISDSLLATNCHILQGAGVIVLLQGEENGRARLVRSHPATDRCLLDSQDMALHPVAGIRAFEDLKMGERVYSVAAPHGLQQTFHDGIVSQLRSNNGISLIQTSAHAAPGSSGGGLFDSAGNLVGITNFTVAEDTRLHFAIAAGAYWD
ncbi:S1 family peptidase [Minwuia sp.]|uniref:S1 family peptidase n=1 Tax=Minwuia sp. TaxID=2493630 RepID=UPI003A930592